MSVVLKYSYELPRIVSVDGDGFLTLATGQVACPFSCGNGGGGRALVGGSKAEIQAAYASFVGYTGTIGNEIFRLASAGFIYAYVGGTPL